MPSPSDSRWEKELRRKETRKKGDKKNSSGKLGGNEAYIHREWEEGRYLQFRGSIHEQVGDTNLGARVTFSPSHVENARAWSKANDPAWLSHAVLPRAFQACFVTTRIGWIKPGHAWLQIQLNLHINMRRLLETLTEDHRETVALRRTIELPKLIDKTTDIVVYYGRVFFFFFLNLFPCKKARLLNDCGSSSPRPLWEHFAIFTALRTTS